VIERHGLLAALDERYDKQPALTQALEEGCRTREVYIVPNRYLEEIRQFRGGGETRRRFGKTFGDLNPEADVELLPWVDALSTHIILSLVAWCRVAVNATLLFEPVRFFVWLGENLPREARFCSSRSRQFNNAAEGLSP